MQYPIEKLFGPDETIWAMFGIHPKHTGGNFDDNIVKLENLIDRYPSNIVALGEIGLDYSRNNIVDPEQQKFAFLMQLKIALRRQLPICLHIREDNDDAFEILQQAKVPENWPIHLHW